MHQLQLVKETARVVSIEGEYAWVEAEAKSGCTSCEVNQTCGTGLLSQLFGRRAFHHRIKNTLNAQPDDLIIVAVPQGGLLLASLVIYLLPIATLFIVAILAESINLSEWGIVLSGGAGLAAGLVLSRWAGRRLEHSVKTQMTMLGKVDPNMVLQIE